jgi:hypothetical protein
LSVAALQNKLFFYKLSVLSLKFVNPLNSFFKTLEKQKILVFKKNKQNHKTKEKATRKFPIPNLKNEEKSPVPRFVRE